MIKWFKHNRRLRRPRRQQLRRPRRPRRQQLRRRPRRPRRQQRRRDRRPRRQQRRRDRWARGRRAVEASADGRAAHAAAAEGVEGSGGEGLLAAEAGEGFLPAEEVAPQPAGLRRGHAAAQSGGERSGAGLPAQRDP